MKKKQGYYKLIIGGIILSSATLILSLLVLYHPSIAEGMVSVVKNRYRDIENSPAENFQYTEPVPNPAVSTPHNTADTPLLTLSKELGSISDLNTDFSSPAEDQTYSVMLDTTLGPMLYYNQGDRRWANYLYGGSDPMNRYGCGPTAIAMLVNSYTSGATPVEIAGWAADNGYYAPQGGSYHSLIPDGLTHFGLSVESVKDHSYENAARLLGTNHVLVALMGKGSLTENGHFILITQILDNGNVQIADPNSYDNSTKEWDLNQLLSELKQSRDSGSPLWAVTVPEAAEEASEAMN